MVHPPSPTSAPHIAPGRPLQLTDFNNLTKSLSLNIFDVRHAATDAGQLRCLEALDRTYSVEALQRTLAEITATIHARPVNVSTQGYEPHGASLVALLNEYRQTPAAATAGRSVVGHLDKSHITFHTYPERHAASGFVSCRVDLDIATCGTISPLAALEHLLGAFRCDVVVIDYRVRGFARGADGRKVAIDQPLRSIAEHISPARLAGYEWREANLAAENLFHLRLKKRAPRRVDCAFDDEGGAASPSVAERVHRAMLEELDSLFAGTA